MWPPSLRTGFGSITCNAGGGRRRTTAVCSGAMDAGATRGNTAAEKKDRHNFPAAADSGCRAGAGCARAPHSDAERRGAMHTAGGCVGIRLESSGVPRNRSTRPSFPFFRIGTWEGYFKNIYFSCVLYNSGDLKTCDSLKENLLLNSLFKLFNI